PSKGPDQTGPGLCHYQTESDRQSQTGNISPARKQASRTSPAGFAKPGPAYRRPPPPAAGLFSHRIVHDTDCNLIRNDRRHTAIIISIQEQKMPATGF
ncbi:hypothetical protein, partial [Acetobacter oeni]|uniref:hypothetical protein n=1 Tax=Acetobacter oeni TaxID=304077 RepID=UPI002230439D